MPGATDSYLTPEGEARRRIDEMLLVAGWVVQDASKVNLAAARGVAVREFILKPTHGRVDDLLFVDQEAVGVVEAKPAGTTLQGVAWQTAKYLGGLPATVPTAFETLPFAYESTGVETNFTNTLDPDAANRQVFCFHRPETPADLSGLPPKDEAVRNLEASFAQGRPRALMQMATGSGKTLLAAFASYRLVKHANARRVLFLVDRANLGRHTLKEFQSFVNPTMAASSQSFMTSSICRRM